jgi:ribosomal peptide maturation radical SAM protein 1
MIADEKPPNREGRGGGKLQSIPVRVVAEGSTAADHPVQKGLPSATVASKKALIIAMPFATPEFPPLGATLIRSVLVASGIPSDIVYGNLVFSKLISGDSFVENTLSQIPICEIAFTPYYFEKTVEEAAEALRQYVLELAVVPESHTPQRYTIIVENAGKCIESLFQSIRWEDYDVVGFSLLMGQTIASLALAKRIKAAHPQISIIIGGAQTHSPMGEEMLRSFRDFDFVLPGEADGIIAQFIRELRLGVRRNFTTRGVLFRNETGEVQSSGEAAPFSDLDSLPVPDFTDFFAQIDDLGLTHIQPYLPLETSRGCWWGEKHHCTFCGIDDKIMVYRSKSPRRVLEEILALSQRHQYTEFFTVDSIINFKFFNELLPILGELRRNRRWDFTFFFESKSNISRDQARRFRYGGVNHVQPGLESFSDHVLKLMDKGTTAVRQIQCLKLLAEQDIVADWNLIIRNPGETAADYREIINLIPFLHHLPPIHEGGLIPMQINRYAPYHNEPKRYGITNIRPKRYYAKVYPDGSADLDRLAFYFDCDFAAPQSEEIQRLHASLQTVLDVWRDCYIPKALVQLNGPSFIKVVDRRSWQPGAPVAPGAEREYLFEGIVAQVFSFCRDMHSVSGVIREFGDTCSPEDVIALIDRFVELRLMYRSPSDEVISLPLVAEAVGQFTFAPGEPEKRALPERQEALVCEGSIQGACDVGCGAVSPDRLALSVTSIGRRAVDNIRTAVPSRIECIFDVDHRPASLVIEDLEAIADRTRSLWFKLVGMETERGIDVALLEALARTRGERLLGFEFACELGTVPTNELAEQMRAAGISSVEVGAVVGRDEPSAIASNLQRIAAVKSLTTAGISVAWGLDERTWSMSTVQREQMVAICHVARHLPSPTLGNVNHMGSLAEAVRLWATTYRPRTLTYAQGPEFVRVFDRRKDDRNWRFISLRGVYAEILLGCEKPKDVAVLRSELSGPTETEIRGYLDSLVAQGVMCRGSDDRHLALPIRRATDERWASADN